MKIIQNHIYEIFCLIFCVCPNIFSIETVSEQNSAEIISPWIKNYDTVLLHSSKLDLIFRFCWYAWVMFCIIFLAELLGAFFYSFICVDLCLISGCEYVHTCFIIILGELIFLTFVFCCLVLCCMLFYDFDLFTYSVSMLFCYMLKKCSFCVSVNNFI